MSDIKIIKYTFKYIVLNKPSGISSDGFASARSILPQLTSQFKQMNPDKKLDPSRFKLVQRLDKYVTGGMLVSRDEKFTKRINKYLAKKESTAELVRRYLGLLPMHNGAFEDQIGEFVVGSETSNGSSASAVGGYKGLSFNDTSLTKGTITFDIEALQKDAKSGKKKLVSFESRTRFQILHHLKFTASEESREKYPELLQSKTIYPIIFELDTGRKNQIRDHTLQAFKQPLLNDDNFASFKVVSQGDQNSVNSTYYKSNQIGLHSAYLKLSLSDTVKEEHHIPVLDFEDRELWSELVNENGEFSEEVRSSIQNF